MLNAMIHSAVIVNVKDTDSAKRLLRLSDKKKVEPEYGFKKLIYFCVCYIMLIHAVMLRYCRQLHVTGLILILTIFRKM